MSLSSSVKLKFEARVGSSIDDLSNSILHAEPRKQLASSDYGRGYVHFGKSVNPKQKDTENLKILNNW